MKMSKWEEISVPKNTPLMVPAQRATRSGEKWVFNTPNRWGFGLKTAIRRAAKHTKYYHLSIQHPFGEVKGRTDDGKEIPVNTLGRWAFGVSGYMGHLIFEGGNSEEIVVYAPPGTPKECYEMIKQAVINLTGR